MSEEKFTKGPWIVNSNGAYFNVGPKNDSSVIPVYPDVCIGVMHYDEANAHLIAAAPDMYEMLKEISDYSKSNGDYLLPFNVEDIDNLLAKARGEQC